MKMDDIQAESETFTNVELKLLKLSLEGVDACLLRIMESWNNLVSLDIVTQTARENEEFRKAFEELSTDIALSQGTIYASLYHISQKQKE